MDNFKAINLIKPELRFNKLISEHRKDRLNPDSRPVYPLDYDLSFDYTCSNCGYKVSIKNHDLEKHSKTDHSNLIESDRVKMEQFISNNKLNDFSFLDFNCPKCGLAVRVLFDCYPGGFCGMTCEIKHVIELRNE